MHGSGTGRTASLRDDPVAGAPDNGPQGGSAAFYPYIQAAIPGDGGTLALPLASQVCLSRSLRVEPWGRTESQRCGSSSPRFLESAEQARSVIAALSPWPPMSGGGPISPPPASAVYLEKAAALR